MKDLSYKIDWLSFSIPTECDQIDDNHFQILRSLDYDLKNFDTISGRYFYNSGITLGNYLNVFFNNANVEKIKGSTDTVTYQWTGQGCVDLYDRIDGNWWGFLRDIKELGAKVTRLDIALDDFVGVLKFSTILSKLEKGHYKSSKKSYNVVRSSDVNRNDKGLTIYIGSARSTSSTGNYYLRMYDKKAQYLEKGQLLPEEIEQAEFWQRYEISYTKQKADEVAEMLSDGEPVDYIFKKSARKIIEFLVPKKIEKEYWKTCKWWEEFLQTDEKIKFDNPERDINLGGLLKWLSVSVMPNIKNLERIADRFGFDIYKMMKDYEVLEFSKKQERLNNELKLKKAVQGSSVNVLNAIGKQNKSMIRNVEREFQKFKEQGNLENRLAEKLRQQALAGQEDDDG